MDFQSVLLDPIYLIQGVEAELTIPASPSPTYTLTVIDKTGGIDLGDGDVNVQTLVPAAIVRSVEMTTVGLDKSQLRGSRIEFNGSTWDITSYRPKPTLNGEADGEYYLLLQEAEDNVTESESEPEPSESESAS